MSVGTRSIQLDDLYQMVSVEDPRISPDGQWIAFVKVTVDRLGNDYRRNIWLSATDRSKLIQLTRSGKDSQPRWSPDGQELAFVSSRDEKPQIYVLPVTGPGGEPRALTQMPNGAHSPEWSPNGNQIAFLSAMNADDRLSEDAGKQDDPAKDKLEQNHRKERKEEDEKARRDPLYMWRVPYRVGTSYLTDRFDQIYVMDTAEPEAGGSVEPRRMTDSEANYDAPSWSPDGQFLYTGRQINIKDDEPFLDHGIYRVRLADKHEIAIQIEDFSCFSPKPSPDGHWIAFERLPNERAGSLMESITRLAVMPVDGGDVFDINLSLDRSIGTFVWSKSSEALVFSAETEGIAPIYRGDIASRSVTEIVTGEFKTLGLDVHHNGGLAFTASTPTSPPELFWFEPEQVYEAKTAFNRDWLDQVIIQDVHEMWFTTPAGNRIQGWYLLPVGYEEGKQYPLALNIHGGPHVMWGPSQESMLIEWQYHAAQGYVVFYCNPRGAAGYGENFQKALHAAWGDVAFEDIMAGVDALLEKGFVDSNRMAVTGGSYGGYMTAWTIGHTDQFSCAVAQRGVYNLISFYGTSDVPSLISGEFDAFPWDNHERLWQHSPVAYAHKIRTPLLIIHSENDYRVPIEQAEQLFAFVRFNGGTVEMWRYPREGHELSRSGEPRHRIDRLEKMTGWFDRYCK